MRLALRAHERFGVAQARATRRSTRCARVGIPAPRGGSTPTRTSSPAACASASPSPSRCCTGPTLIIADEPTTALDVSIQAQILAEMRGLVARDRHGADLDQPRPRGRLLARRPHRVMYAGRIVEIGETHDVLTNPQHHYTRRLLNALPSRSTPGQLLARRADVRDAAPPPRQPRKAQATAIGAPFLVLDSVSKQFGKTPGLVGRPPSTRGTCRTGKPGSRRRRG